MNRHNYSGNPLEKMLSERIISIIDYEKIKIEQPYELLLFSDEIITLHVGDRHIHIKGEGLVVTLLWYDELIIEGRIQHLTFTPSDNDR